MLILNHSIILTICILSAVNIIFSETVNIAENSNGKSQADKLKLFLDIISKEKLLRRGDYDNVLPELSRDLPYQPQLVLPQPRQKIGENREILKQFLGKTQFFQKPNNNEYLMEIQSTFPMNRILESPHKKSDGSFYRNRIKTSIGPKRNFISKQRGVQCCGSVGNWCRICRSDGVTSDEVTQRFLNDYAYVPQALVNLTQHEGQKELCENLSVNLFEADVKKLDLGYKINSRIGFCPSMLQTKDLQIKESIFPSKIIEVKCLCDSSSCSNKGYDYKCVPAKEMINIWYKHNNKFSSLYRNVTVACLCVQKIGEAAGNIDSVYQYI